MVLALVAFGFDNPPWLAFSFARFNPALVLVVALLPASLVAVLMPSLRAWRAGAGFGEIALACGLLAWVHVYALLGAPAWCAAATAGVLATDLGVRAVHARIAGRPTVLLSPRHGLVVLPVLAHLAWPTDSSAAIWGALAAAAALGCLPPAGHARCPSSAAWTQLACLTECAPRALKVRRRAALRARRRGTRGAPVRSPPRV